MNSDLKMIIAFGGTALILAWLLTHAGPAGQVINASSGGFAQAVGALEPPSGSSSNFGAPVGFGVN